MRVEWVFTTLLQCIVGHRKESVITFVVNVEECFRSAVVAVSVNTVLL